MSQKHEAQDKPSLVLYLSHLSPAYPSRHWSQMNSPGRCSTHVGLKLQHTHQSDRSHTIHRVHIHLYLYLSTYINTRTHAHTHTHSPSPSHSHTSHTWRKLTNDTTHSPRTHTHHTHMHGTHTHITHAHHTRTRTHTTHTHTHTTHTHHTHLLGRQCQRAGASLASRSGVSFAGLTIENPARHSITCEAPPWCLRRTTLD